MYETSEAQVRHQSSAPGSTRPACRPWKRFQDRQKELGRPMLGPVLTVDSPLVAMLAAQSFDWVMIDMEHSPFSAAQMTHMVHSVVAASQGQCLPVVRIPSHNVEWVKWALDSGAAGIVIPMVNNAGEMKRILDHAIYPPHGKRSFGPFQAPFGRQLKVHPTGFAEYYDSAQDNGVAVLPIIESVEGLQNADEILQMDGVAGAFIGPYDLRLSMGLPGGLDGAESSFNNALRKICAIGKRYGKMIGSMGIGAELAVRRADMGMTFLLTTVDYNVLSSGFTEARTEIEQALGRGQPKLT